MSPAFALSIRHPQTGSRLELVVNWKASGWEIHELDGTVTTSDSEGLKLMDLLRNYKLSAPDLRPTLWGMWCELDLVMEPVSSPSQDVDVKFPEFQDAFNKLGSWIEATTAAAPKGEYFQSP